ncbi:N-carbamoylputrescine amidase [Natronospirillum operosum]|uniref:N-carbamoylputrescine amidase n=1 Tax=Natronospirillum operosum TaxID=2759953 RepID=A0A4Z0WBC2_9GAMM|nr:N-carbamoylputrescine amidase [Natronospirillum operosum]TGG91456.1 N-carbamoylputrescine amidase [Natronospirillum operosum]
MTRITVAATQMPCGWDVNANIEAAEALVRQASAQGAQIILLQELFERRYFCQHQDYDHLAHATALEDNPAVQHFQAVAHELKVVLPISFYERDNNAYYNSIAIIDADGSVLGLYRKAHIPDGPGYSEKFYFTPGDTGFKVWDTAYARIGVGICWDQWFPETARAMALMGAELLFFPTAIGSEPQDPTLDSRPHWLNTQCGHAAANVMPLIASNRVGTEAIDGTAITFYGNSFIADETGTRVGELDTQETGVVTHSFDLAALRTKRHAWGVFRDRRPELYGALLTKDGHTAAQS